MINNFRRGLWGRMRIFSAAIILGFAFAMLVSTATTVQSGQSSQNTTDDSGSKVTKENTTRSQATQIAALISGRISSFIARAGRSFAPRLQADSAPGFAPAATGLSASADGPARYGVWFNQSLTRFSDSTVATDFKADLWASIVGVDYQVNDRTLIGLTGVYDRTAADTNFNGGSQQTVGWTIAPYVAYRFNDILSADISGGHTSLDKDMSRQTFFGAVTANTQARRNFVAVNLNAYRAINQLTFSGSFGYLYAHETTDAFFETDGSLNGETNLPLGQVRASGRIGYVLLDLLPRTVIEPYFRVRYDNELNSNRIDVGLGQAQHPNDTDEFNLGGGIDIFAGSDFSANLEVFSSAGRQNFDAFSIALTLRLRV